MSNLNKVNESVVVTMKENRRGRAVPDYDIDDINFDALTAAVNELLETPVSDIQVEDALLNQRRSLETITQEPLFLNVPVMAHLVTYHMFKMITVDGALKPVVTLKQLHDVTGRGVQTMNKHFDAKGVNPLTDDKTQLFDAYAAYAVAVTIDTRQGGGGSKVFVNDAIKAFSGNLQEQINDANEVLEAAGQPTIDTLVFESVIKSIADGMAAYKADKEAKKAAKAAQEA